MKGKKTPSVPLVGWEAVRVDPQTMGDCGEGGLCGIEVLDPKKCCNLEDYGALGLDLNQKTLPFLKKKSKKKKKRKVKQEKVGLSKKASKSTPKPVAEKVDEIEEVSEPWKELDLDPFLLSAVKKCGFKFPLPIQSYCIPAAVKRRKDVLGAAETGSGKTLAFGIPIFQRILEETQGNKAPVESTPLQKEQPEMISDSEDLVELDISEEEEDFENEAPDGVTRVYDDQTELVISNAEIAQLDRELGMVSFTDLYRKPDPNTALKALILTPTRELALQCCKHLQAIGQDARIRVVPVVGGMAPQKQTRLLSYNPEVVVATPGRFLDLYRKGTEHLRDLSQLKFFVVDECDKMIRHGDFKDLTVILQCIPEYQLQEETFDANNDKGKKRKDKRVKEKYKIPSEERKMQTLLFSATLTLPRSLHQKLKPEKKKKEAAEEDVDEMAVALDHLRFRGEPEVVDLTSKAKLASRVQEAYILCEEDKVDAVVYSILIKYPGRTLIFCNAIKNVRRLTESLRLLGIPAQPIHAAKQQSQRLKALDRFRAFENGVLVATDVAARGLDIPDVRYVIHYNVSFAADLYIHRSGRTARVEADGLALSMVTPSETLRFNALFKALERKKPPEFPVDQSCIPESVMRCSLARQIRDLESKLSFRKKDLAWNKKTAEALQTQMAEEEGSESEEEDVEEEHVKEECEELREQLRHRLALPLDCRVSKKYFTGDATLRRKPAEDNQKKRMADSVKENVNKAARVVSGKGKKANPAEMVKTQRKVDPVARHREKLEEVLSKKTEKKQKMKSLSYAKQKLVVIPAALGREAQGPDALHVMRKYLQRKQSSRL